MPWIEPEYLESVVYLYPSEAEAEDGAHIGGSGFILGVPLIAKNRSSRVVLCIVTNKHVIDSGNMVVRINTIDGGKDIVPLDGAKWYTHPDGDDLAVCPIRLVPAIHRIKYIPTNLFLKKETIEKFDIGPGDDVFFVGRFVNHEGRERNLPSVRFGNISQMPWEPIVIEGHPQESFLVEARSISGYSGSPVYVYLPPQLNGALPEVAKMVADGVLKIPNVSQKRAQVPLQLGPWLLGVDFCHLRWDEPVWSKVTREPVNKDWFIKSNTGMMGVVPAWKLHEIVEGAEMKPVLDEVRKAAEEAAKKDFSVELDVANLSKSAPPANDENPKHREDFNSLVGAAARKPKSTDQT